jgi:hypothetical protein
MSLPDLIAQDIAKLQEDLAALLNPVNTAPIPPKPVNTAIEPFGIVNPPTLLTIFALQWDGKTPDPSDNGVGAWGANTRDANMIGCALPIKLLESTFGGGSIKGFTVEFYSHVTQVTVRNVDIVDAGPAAWTHRLADGTFGLHKALGHIDYGVAHYGSYPKWPAGFWVSYWITDPNGKAVEIKGIDFKHGKVIGS